MTCNVDEVREQPIHIRRGGLHNVVRYGTYHFQNRSIPALNRHRNCAGPSESNVNSRALR